MKTLRTRFSKLVLPTQLTLSILATTSVGCSVSGSPDVTMLPSDADRADRLDVSSSDIVSSDVASSMDAGDSGERPPCTLGEFVDASLATIVYFDGAVVGYASQQPDAGFLFYYPDGAFGGVIIDREGRFVDQGPCMYLA